MTLPSFGTRIRAAVLIPILGFGLAGLLLGCAQNDLTTKNGTSGSANGNPSLSLDKSSLTFQSVANSGTLPSANLQATYSGDHMIVGVPPGQGPAGWISVKTNSLSIGHVGYIVAITSTNMTPGTYTTTLRFSTARTDGSGAVYVDLPVTYTLTASSLIDGSAERSAEVLPESAINPEFAAYEGLAKASGIERILCVTPAR